MGRPKTPADDPLEYYDSQRLAELMALDGRSAAAVAAALARRSPPLKLSAATISRLVNGQIGSTRRSVRKALERELLGGEPELSPLRGECTVEEARSSVLMRALGEVSHVVLVGLEVEAERIMQLLGPHKADAVAGMLADRLRELLKGDK